MKIIGWIILSLFLFNGVLNFGFSGKCKRAVAIIYRVKTDIAVISYAIDSYKLENETLPTSLSELLGTYLNVLPADPWGVDYYYEIQSRKEVRVFTLGYDLEAGGTGLATDMSMKIDFSGLIEYIREPIFQCNT
ncbi:MAG: type II secretion system protein GspG [Kangiellaceae bacterium]|nr:type II secretion system protein GspG [Kangiellaceae bacterium]